jgi:hypothetical protein
MGKKKRDWQNVSYVLKLFGDKTSDARRAEYQRSFLLNLKKSSSPGSSREESRQEAFFATGQSTSLGLQ